MNKKIFILPIFLFISFFGFAEDTFNAICNFTLGSSLNDFKNSDIYQFAYEEKNKNLSEMNCICFSYEPYNLKADSKGKQGNFEEINNKKIEFTKENTLVYGNGKIYKISLYFFEEKLIIIRTYFYGEKDYIDKKGIVHKDKSDDFISYNSSKWYVLQTAVAEKYGLIETEKNDLNIIVDSTGNVSSDDRKRFLNYNVNEVLREISIMQAAERALAQIKGKAYSAGASKLVMHQNIFLSRDSTRKIEFSTWSFHETYKQPVIILYDNEAYTKMLSQNIRNQVDNIKDQI